MPGVPVQYLGTFIPAGGSKEISQNWRELKRPGATEFIGNGKMTAVARPADVGVAKNRNAIRVLRQR